MIQQPTLSDIPPSKAPLLTPITKIPRQRRVELIDAIPQARMMEWGAKIFTLMNLTWQYIETILDIAIQMRISETKPLVRAIRHVKLEYDRYRAKALDKEFIDTETRIAETFEDKNNDIFKRLFYGLDFEVSKLDLEAKYKPLVIATQQALTLMDAIKVYSQRAERIIEEEYDIVPDDCCFIEKHFKLLYTMIPQFAGDCYQRNISARKLTAEIIAKKMEQSIIKIKTKEENNDNKRQSPH